jgi:hypothetical protein
MADPVTTGEAPTPQEAARRKRRCRAIHVALPLIGGLLGAAGVPILLHTGHRWAFLLYALAIVIASNIASVTIDPPERRAPARRTTTGSRRKSGSTERVASRTADPRATRSAVCQATPGTGAARDMKK